MKPKIRYMGSLCYLAVFSYLVCTLSLGISADNRASFSLKPEEQKEILQAAKDRDQTDKRFNAIAQAAATNVDALAKCETATALLSAFQSSYAAKDAADARFERIKAEHRLAYGCANCDYAPDWTSLVRKESK
jgi:hypothetical protein